MTGDCDGVAPSAKRAAIVARIASAVSESTSSVDGMRAKLPYTRTIAAARGASMHAMHLVKRTVWPCCTNAVVTMRVDPLCTLCLHRLLRAREVGAIPMW